MAWSKWKGACVVGLLASVGLAWSQAPMGNRSTPPSPERIMTLHENGKALRCRVVQSWRTSNGTQAYQLQVIETGELVTILEDGPATTVPGSSATRLPMRILHWGQRDRVPPAGAPVPPQVIEPARTSPIQRTSVQTVTPAAATVSPCDGVIVGNTPRIIPSPQEKVVSWEAGGGKSATIYPNKSLNDCLCPGPAIVDCCPPAETPRQGLFPRLFGSSKPSPMVVDNCQPGTVVTVNVPEPKSTSPRDKVTAAAQTPQIVKPAEPRPVEPKIVKSVEPKIVKPAEPKPVEAKRETKKENRMPTELPAPVVKKDDKKAATIKKEEKTPFSTATAQTTPTPKTLPLAISDTKKKDDPKAVADAIKKEADQRKMWGTQTEVKVEQPVRKDLPPASQTERKKQDILMAPEKFIPGSEKANPKASAEIMNAGAQQMPGRVPTPLGVQSVLAARNGAQGPVMYIPVPVATVPEPIRAPTPPPPNVPQPPNPTAFVNAFSPPPGQNQQPLAPEQIQVVMQQQALMQQQAYLQQQAMLQRMQYGQTAQLVPVGYGMPMQVNYPAVYSGPQAPNPIVQQASPIQQVGFVPPANPMVNAAMDRRVAQVSAQTAAGGAMSDANTVAQIIKVLQESPYPAQREWAATNLATFDGRVYPHLTQVLGLAARQDSAANVRAAAVYGLSRMNLQNDAVLGTLSALRGDADPQVRQEVEQAYLRMGLTPTQP